MARSGTDSRILTDFMIGITSARTVEDGFLALHRSVESMGFGAIVYSAHPLTLMAESTIKPTFLAAPGFSQGFLSHYEQADLAQADFTIERVLAGHLDVMDWREEQPRLTHEQQAVIDLARVDYGIRSALSVPTMSDKHMIAGTSITSDEPVGRFATLKRERLPMLRKVIELFHFWVFMEPERRQPYYRPIVTQFSDLEICVIQLVISGKRLKSSQELCGISSTHAGNILSRLYQRLGISNAAELAYLVGVHQLDHYLHNPSRPPTWPSRYAEPVT